jgi:hypothetical protein
MLISCHITFCRPIILCLLSCIIETVQVTEGRMLASLDLNIYVLLITALVRGNGRYSNYASVANSDPVVRSSPTVQYRIAYASATTDLRIRIRHCYAYKPCNWNWQPAEK